MFAILVLQSHIINKRGTFNAQCKIQSGGVIPNRNACLNITLLRIGKEPSDEDAFEHVLFDNPEDLELVDMANDIIGKSFLDFQVELDSYPESLRYEGLETGKLTYRAKGTYAIGGVTQTIWGGANTQYMACTSLTTNKSNTETIDNILYTNWEFDVTKEDLTFAPQRGAASNTSAYNKSEVARFFQNHSYPGTDANHWTTGITPKTLQKYWPKTRKDEQGNAIKGGPKHGEMIVVTLGFISSFTMPDVLPGVTVPQKIIFLANAGRIMQAAVRKDGKLQYKIPVITYKNEQYQIYNVTNAAYACSANVFTTYDIYWNTWSVALTSVLMILSTIVIVPTKCFNLKALLQKKHAVAEQQFES